MKPFLSNTTRPLFALLFLLALGSYSRTPAAETPQPMPPAAQRAERLFAERQWVQAAEAYREITRASPGDGQAWLRLGSSLHALGKEDEAISALQKAVTLLKNANAMFALATACAKSRKIDEAYKWLDKAIDAGFARVGLLRTDPDLHDVRLDKRFDDLLQRADKIQRPCLYQPEYKQFDFWVGDWDVTREGKHVGFNSIEKVANDCILLENWTADGATNVGKSLNFYDASVGKWQQTWMDGQGSALNLSGEFKDNAMRYKGETVDKAGARTLHKLTFFKMPNGQVRQLWEQSTDAGKTWASVWDAIYTRRKRAP